MTEGADAAADASAVIERDGAAFGRADAALLRAIASRGSVSGAARELGRSRARALTRLQDLEAAFGELVDRRRGGSDGGGSRLTDDARELLARYDRLRANLAETASVVETVLPGRVVEVTGELGTVKTGAGTLRALVVPDAGSADGFEVDSRSHDVEVSVRASAVTLHDPADAPPGGATSARNRFDGRVEAVDSGVAVAHVSVDVGAADPLVALVTCDSVERLGLEPGAEVVASFKATATRAVQVDDEPGEFDEA
ncbi:TOBE domain-containing protein (plasmid) [Halorarum halophilum]|uniref:TOBE domain-containing protein n=1 Tax=Halorarum halophilum TaxID=2743090 RepID=A0A7D5GHA2_9EURY|nr:TOBE domain-containing protein [Halobaculum halophilum]QLG29768.1 TOBE domain-containing protein [Halobaculum halophilum]